MPNKSVKSHSDNSQQPIKNVVIGSIIGTVLLFAFLAVFSLISLKSDVFSSSAYMPAGFISGCLSAFAGGFVSVKPIKNKGIYYGFLAGLIQAVISAAAIYIINSNHIGKKIFIFMILIVVFSSIGGISAVNVKIKKKY